MSQITHRTDENGALVQIVTPQVLRQVLDAEGSDYSRPADFGPDDEWNVGQVMQTYTITSGWQVKPEDQGQIVEISYALAGEDEVILRRVTDYSDNSVTIYAHETDYDAGPYEPWNNRVPLGECLGECLAQA